jgi:hypothetical protein
MPPKGCAANTPSAACTDSSSPESPSARRLASGAFPAHRRLDITWTDSQAYNLRVMFFQTVSDVG